MFFFAHHLYLLPNILRRMSLSLYCLTKATLFHLIIITIIKDDSSNRNINDTFNLAIFPFFYFSLFPARAYCSDRSHIAFTNVTKSVINIQLFVITHVNTRI